MPTRYSGQNQQAIHPAKPNHKRLYLEAVEDHHDHQYYFRKPVTTQTDRSGKPVAL
jgi:hypothetical protein